MRTLLIIGILSFACSGAEWRRATEDECSTEAMRELSVMSKAGFTGDPPITLGMATSSMDLKHPDRQRGHSYSPCGYTDGQSFRAVYSIFVGVNVYEVTREQYESLWVPSRKGDFLEYSAGAMKRLVSLAKHGKLKKL